MRDLAVFALFAVGLVYAMKNPYYGVLLWSLFDYMSPHRLTWGPAFSFPFVYIIALVTLFSFLVSSDKKPIPFSLTLGLWVVFLLWTVVTTLVSLEPDLAWARLIEVLKIQVPIFLTLFLFYNKQRLDLLIAVIVFSVGFFGVKGGIFTLMTGGNFIVWGPEGTFIGGNNELAVAILSVTPLLMYLRKQTDKVWLKRALLGAALLMVVSAVGTQSRGAFLALVATGIYFWWRSDNKLPWAAGMLVLAMLGAAMVPDTWKQRMETIQNYEEDGSAMGRIRAWKFAIHLADARLTGGGFDPWNKKNYLVYLPDYSPDQTAFVAHSIYFSVLGEHGWPGLILFLTIFWTTWVRLGKVARKTRNLEKHRWMADLANAIRVGMVAYFVGGAFLSIAYFDLPWHFVAIGLILSNLSRQVTEEKPKVPLGARYFLPRGNSNPMLPR